jgi:5-methylcytosine-specific restriction endonuclease McrBC regulatory subunit McrC
MPQTLIKVPERGSVAIPRSLCAKLTAAPQFWTLIERGILALEHVTAAESRLRGGPFVGRANIGDQLAIELDEKIPGSIQSMLSYASKADFRIQNLPSQGTAIGPLISLLADQFADTVARYLARGREFSYRRDKRIGTLIGGKINITGTARLRARGLRHLAQFEKNALTSDVPTNRVILAALRELERINRLLPLHPATLARTRSLATLFSDCRTQEVLFGAREGLIKMAMRRQTTSSGDSLLQDVMALAGVLLSHESFEHANAPSSPSPRSWFLNLETLFEAAVRNLFSTQIGTAGAVYNGRNTPAPIFPSSGSQYRANPDLVIRLHGGTCAIGDAKFKVPEQTAAPGDIYQLLTHAAAFGATEAFLVYPHEAFGVVDLGLSKTAAHVRLFTVDIRSLSQSVAKILHLLLPTPASKQGTASEYLPLVAQS